jgi:hypothetical protein
MKTASHLSATTFAVVFRDTNALDPGKYGEELEDRRQALSRHSLSLSTSNARAEMKWLTCSFFRANPVSLLPLWVLGVRTISHIRCNNLGASRLMEAKSALCVIFVAMQRLTR